MVKKSLDIITIYALKKQLCDAIVDNNYDLQSPEILTLSSELDCLMLPLFKEQLNSCKNTYISHF